MLECGDKIGDYVLARFLGRGQFGEVWLAEKELQFSTRKFQHALKFLFKLGDEVNLKAVEAEIDTWIEASGHPNVMSVLDMIVYREYIIIVSEYAEGGSLKRWLTRHSNKAPSHEKALEMMTGILRGIEHLHSRNVVHRDLKPDNILLQGNFPRITDFGISRIVSAGSLSTVAMGSPFYMSPESFDGSKSIQTDIWSAGVLLYEMLSGEHPYRSETIYGLVTAIRQDAPKPLPADIPDRLRKIVDTALQKDMLRRYPTARAMRSAIEPELHKLKAFINSRPDLLQTDQQFSDESSTATLEAVHIDGDANIPVGKKAKQTHKTSAKDTIGKNQSAGMPERKGSDAQEPPLNWSQKTVTSKAIDLQGIVKGQEIGSPAMSFTDSGFGNSQLTPPTRRWLFITAIAGVLILGFVAGVVALISVGKTILFSGPPANVVTSSLGALPGNTTSKENKPVAPIGMVYVPGGTFTMGRDDSEIAEEKPAHSATVEPFFIDIYEVTNEDYLKFVNQSGHKPPPQWKNSSYAVGQEKFPVVGVNWEDARFYAEWARKRLPTEEEWEFAARDSDSRVYPWGNDWDQSKANIQTVRLKPVGSFPCDSPFGVCDMIGNAWEWTASDFKNYDGSTPIPNRKGNEKTRRGNSYEGDEKHATTTYRLGLAATGMNGLAYSQTGFRCVKDIK